MEDNLRYHASEEDPKEPEPATGDVADPNELDEDDLDDVAGGVKPTNRALYAPPVSD